MTARPRLTDAGADGASGGEPSGPPPRMQVRLESGKLIGSWCTAVPAARDPQRHYSECGKNLPKKWCAERPMSTEGRICPRCATAAPVPTEQLRPTPEAAEAENRTPPKAAGSARKRAPKKTPKKPPTGSGPAPGMLF